MPMSDEEAVKEYEKQKATIEEIKDETPEVWAKKQQWKAKIKQK